MKKVAYVGVILVLLAVSVIPVLAKSPSTHNSGAAGTVPVSSGGVNPADKGNGNNKEGKGNNGTNGNGDKGGSSSENGKGNGNQVHTRTRTPFYLQGTISAIDQGAKTITITLVHGNAQVKQFIGTTLVIQAGNASIFKITQGADDESGLEIDHATTSAPNGEQQGSGERSASTHSITESDTDTGNRVAIPLTDLAVGQKVAIHGNVVNTAYNATVITVYLTQPVGESSGG